MANNTDLLFPVTAKKIGPSGTVLSRPKVVYLRSSDLRRVAPDVLRSGAVLFLSDPNQRKVEVYEMPDEVMAEQALAQGATAAAPFSKNYAVAAPTSSATAADQTTLKYYNQVITNVGSAQPLRLPDPFVKRLVVIDNQTTGSIAVLGRGTTTPIQGSTANYTIGPGERIHFVAPTAATAGTTAPWKTAVDVGA